jgi:uncharacterized protein (DUF58 family)
MRWPPSLLRSRDRRLEVSVGGRWYIVFTILLGVVAIYSANNVIYLLESLLLSALILSGVLSEVTISRVGVERELGQGEAGKGGGDSLVLTNRFWLPLYCIEILEWAERGEIPLAFALYLPARGRERVRSQQAFAERGFHAWRGFVIATSFPFGFARKLRYVRAPGRRIVWPERLAADARQAPRARPRPELEVSLGDLEEVRDGDDISRVHWPSSARAGKYLARPLRRINDEEEVVLHFVRPTPEAELAIARAAGRLQRATQTLLLYHGKDVKRITGAVPGLDALALLPKAAAP